MKTDNEKLFARLNSIIIYTAIRGNCHVENGWTTLYWTMIRLYVFAYMEDAETNTVFFRVFRCQDTTLFEKRCLLRRDYPGERVKCLYDSSEHEEKRTVSYCEDFSVWLEDAMQAADISLEFLIESCSLI